RVVVVYLHQHGVTDVRTQFANVLKGDCELRVLLAAQCHAAVVARKLQQRCQQGLIVVAARVDLELVVHVILADAVVAGVDNQKKPHELVEVLVVVLYAKQ
ncbi:hypothetical protein CATMIT_01709, partial [Catenibacterium mitsuokai DSM 15897]